MTEADLLPRLTEIVRDVFGDDTIVLRPEMTAADLAGWDSMNLVTLAVEIEHRLGVRFKSSEMEAVGCIGDLLDLIKVRLPVTAS